MPVCVCLQASLRRFKEKRGERLLREQRGEVCTCLYHSSCLRTQGGLPSAAMHTHKCRRAAPHRLFSLTAHTARKAMRVAVQLLAAWLPAMCGQVPSVTPANPRRHSNLPSALAAEARQLRWLPPRRAAHGYATACHHGAGP